MCTSIQRADLCAHQYNAQIYVHKNTTLRFMCTSVQHSDLCAHQYNAQIYVHKNTTLRFMCTSVQHSDLCAHHYITQIYVQINTKRRFVCTKIQRSDLCAHQYNTQIYVHINITLRFPLWAGEHFKGSWSDNDDTNFSSSLVRVRRLTTQCTDWQHSVVYWLTTQCSVLIDNTVY
jgi:hypothetical protein